MDKFQVCGPQGSFLVVDRMGRRWWVEEAEKGKISECLGTTEWISEFDEGIAYVLLYKEQEAKPGSARFISRVSKPWEHYSQVIGIIMLLFLAVYGLASLLNGCAAF